MCRKDQDLVFVLLYICQQFHRLSFSFWGFTLNPKVYFLGEDQPTSNRIAQDWTNLTINTICPKGWVYRRHKKCYKIIFEESRCPLTFTTPRNLFIKYILLLFFPRSFRPFTRLLKSIITVHCLRSYFNPFRNRNLDFG